MGSKIFCAVGLKRAIGLFFSTAVLLSTGYAKEGIPEYDWHSRPKDEAIEFKDPHVHRNLMRYGMDKNRDGAISYAEAAANNGNGIYFKGFRAIKTFDEFEYFTGVTSIVNQAFLGCSNLMSISIPNSVTSIGESAFKNCSSLTSITIPNSVTEIGEGAFAVCRSLEKIEGKFASSDNRCLVVDGKLTAFAPAGLTEYTIPYGVTKIGDKAFDSCSSLTSITIPNNVTEIGEGAFASCRSLEKIEGKFASSDNRCLVVDGKLTAFAPAGLTEYTIPNSVTEIGEGAFVSCRSLTSITIPDSVTEIGNNAFAVCSSLTSITIPDSVTEIGNNAFSGCSSLTSIYCKPTTPPTLGFYDPTSVDPTLRSDIKWYLVFSNISASAKIYVPRTSVSAYKAAAGWSNYANMIVGYDF